MKQITSLYILDDEREEESNMKKMIRLSEEEYKYLKSGITDYEYEITRLNKEIMRLRDDIDIFKKIIREHTEDTKIIKYKNGLFKITNRTLHIPDNENVKLEINAVKVADCDDSKL